MNNLKVTKSPWAKLEIEVISKENRDELLKLLISAMKQAEKVGLFANRDVVYLGFNRTMKGMEKGVLHSVCVARDTPIQICRAIMDAAVVRKVRLIILPKSALELTVAFDLKRVYLFGIRSSSAVHISSIKKHDDNKTSFDIKEDEEKRAKDNDLNAFYGLMDKVRDMVDVL